MRRRGLQFSSVRTEGGLLPQDVLARIQAGDKDLPGLTPESYHLGSHERIGEAVNRSWSRLIGSWRSFQEALAKEPESSTATAVTRDRWLLPLFEELLYGRLPKGQAIEVGGKSYAVSHSWHRSPMHLLGAGIDLDRRHAGISGAAKASPHGLVQEFLNRSEEHRWGFVSNGLRLRLLRDHHSLTRQAYVEFDLQAIMEGEQFSEFLLFWMVCHQSRVEAEKPEDCWLERWFETSRDQGIRALDKLRGGVEKAIESFGTGFLTHRANVKLRSALESGELDKQEYYRQVLRLVYRLIFLFVAEERDALFDPQATDEAKIRYLRFYATRRLRDLSGKRRGGPHADLWQGLRLVMSKLDDGYPELALPALGSRLWGSTACLWLMDTECGNEHLLDAVRRISTIEEGRTRYSVDWRNVGADELGSIYEGLLELHPRMNKEAGTFELDIAAGHERKTTGSYYTPTELVDCLLGSALDPVLDAASREPDAEAAILNLKVCDPACGSGHFLVAAARRIAKRLAAVRAEEDEPSPREVQRALRDVVGRCIYGVDVNPMAVELCKVSLWIEAIEPGRPLSFLDSHIQCGNALLGATPALMARGIPDDAFTALEGDDNEVAKALKRQNKTERGGQTTLFSYLAAGGSGFSTLTSQAAVVESEPDESIGAVRRKSADWDRLTRSPEFRDAWFQSDAWCSVFMWPMEPGDLAQAAITEAAWRRIRRDASDAGQLTKRTVRGLAREHGFFHWHLAFPQIFKEKADRLAPDDPIGWDGGFDLVIGNPPWERVKIQEREWFSGREKSIADEGRAAIRAGLIDHLREERPALWLEWRQAVGQAESAACFIRNSGRFPSASIGDLNTYPCFSELSSQLVSSSGMGGLVLPQGCVTDKAYSGPFRTLLKGRRLSRVAGFVNEKGLFPGVMHNVKFVVFTFSGEQRVGHGAVFSFNAETVAESQADESQYELTIDDISRVNPDTLTCPVFKFAKDAAIVRNIYRSLATLGASDWSLSFGKTLHMGSYSKDFQSRGAGLLPVYESKMVGQYNHRRCSFEHLPPGDRSHILPAVSEEQLGDPAYMVAPCYEIAPETVRPANSDSWPYPWHIVYRRITSLEVDRTVEVAILPDVGMSDSLMVVRPPADYLSAFGFIAMCNSFAFDYVARTKLGGRNLSQYIFNQIAVPSRSAVIDNGLLPIQKIAEMVLELSYTSWDLHALAVGIGKSSSPYRWDSQRRLQITCELDAVFMHLYGFRREDVEYVLDSFWVVRDTDVRGHGNYRTKLKILEVYDCMHEAVTAGVPYRSALDPPPADPQIAHAPGTRPPWVVPMAPLPIDVPSMPEISPVLDPRTEPGIVVWAMVHASNGSIARLRLARAFALRSDPGLLARLAPREVEAAAGDWLRRVGDRSRSIGLAAVLRTLADRDGVRLTNDARGQSVVSASPHTPPDDQLDEWYRFEARLALRVLDALPTAAVDEVDSALSAADRALMQGGGA